MLIKYFAQNYSYLDTTNSNNNTTTVLESTISNSSMVVLKKIFFLTKSVNSIRLYASIFRAHTDFRISEYYYNTDDDDCCLDKRAFPWKTSDDFTKQLISFDIHLMLDSVFELLLKCNFVKVDNIQLLILDDVHKIVYNTFKNDNHINISSGFFQDSYSRIIRKLRAVGFVKNSPNYRILGLSASILIENVSSKVFEYMISKIEAALDCTCETFADLQVINNYSIPCRIKLKYYSPLTANRCNTEKSSFKLDQDRFKFSLFLIRNYASQYYNFLVHMTDSKLSGKVCCLFLVL